MILTVFLISLMFSIGIFYFLISKKKILSLEGSKIKYLPETFLVSELEADLAIRLAEIGYKTEYKDTSMILTNDEGNKFYLLRTDAAKFNDMSDSDLGTYFMRIEGKL